MPKIASYNPLPVLFCAVAVLLPCLVAQAQGLDSSVQTETQINRDSAKSQQRVSSLAQQTQDLLYEYRAVVRETEALRTYNDNLERIVTDQRDEIQSVNRQLAGLEETNRGVVPLMLEMIEVLERIVEADIPFRIEERRARVARLRDMMDQAEVTASEKYRRVMEAYQGELEFGRTTEAYSETLPTTGQTVDFLRVGRTLLVYQSSDGATTGWFNPVTRAFEGLPDRYRLEVQDGLAIARNEKAPDLVMLPVPGPEVRAMIRLLPVADRDAAGHRAQMRAHRISKNWPGWSGRPPPAKPRSTRSARRASYANATSSANCWRRPGRNWRQRTRAVTG